MNAAARMELRGENGGGDGSENAFCLQSESG